MQGEYNFTQQKQTADMTDAIVVKGKYRHFKGNEYQVIEIATHSESLEEMVIYYPLSDERKKLWVRPKSMFLEKVKLANGSLCQRFTLIVEES